MIVHAHCNINCIHITGKMDVVYSSYLTLATYFEQFGDILFSNHFYKQCIEASVKVRGDGRRKEAEANFNMGVTYEKQGLNFLISP